MASENETVAKVLDDFSYLITIGDIGSNIATDIKNRFEAAHNREIAAKDAEIAKLKEKWHEALNIADSVEKCASIERHTEAMFKKNEVIAGLRKEIAELTAMKGVGK